MSVRCSGESQTVLKMLGSVEKTLSEAKANLGERLSQKHEHEQYRWSCLSHSESPLISERSGAGRQRRIYKSIYLNTSIYLSSRDSDQP